MNSQSLEICGVPVTLTRKRIKNMHIRISSCDGSVAVSVPMFTSGKTAEKFIESRIEWIKENRKRILSSAAAEPKFTNGETVYFCGKPYVLKTAEGGKNSVILEGNEITVTAKKQSAEQCRRLLYDFYKKSLTERATRMLSEAEILTGLKAESLTVRDMKTRWGSCNTVRRKICLNLQLAKYSDRVLNYIVIHEILHIRHPNHGAEFKSELTKYCPDWKEIKRELNGGK